MNKRFLNCLMVLITGYLMINAQQNDFSSKPVSKKPWVMVNHDPFSLMKMDHNKPISLPVFRNSNIVIFFDADLSTVPTGCYIDENFKTINAVEQSYITEKPGYILFEKIAEVLEKHNKIVFRSYKSDDETPSGLNDYKKLKLRLNDFELHQWKTKENKEYYLGKIELSYSFDDNVWKNLLIKSKIESSKDFFEYSAEQIISELKSNF